MSQSNIRSLIIAAFGVVLAIIGLVANIRGNDDAAYLLWLGTFFCFCEVVS
jgi:hypothetical protein